MVAAIPEISGTVGENASDPRRAGDHGLDPHRGDSAGRRRPVTLRLAPLMRVSAEVGEVVSLGAAPGGERRVVAILGGTFEGDDLAGEVLSGGADWQLKWDDGTLSIDAHYALRERGGALIEVRSQGLRTAAPGVLERLARGEEVDPGEYYFRTAMRFTTGDARLGWLNRIVAVATAARRPRRVELEVHRVL
jgi:hypothetical protein